jgi:hypothetical protein
MEPERGEESTLALFAPATHAVWLRTLGQVHEYQLCEAEFIGKIRLLGVNLPTSVLASAAFVKI